MYGFAQKTGEWAGIPTPLNKESELPLVIDPSYPFAEWMTKLSYGKTQSEEDKEPDYKIRNRFWSWRYKSWIIVGEEADGKIIWGKIPGFHNAAMQIKTIGASDAWGMEQEITAIDTLRSLINDRQFHHYIMTGSFLESSKCSTVRYVFRRLRPTIALNSEVKILACLCLHPIAYYEGSWAGAMCPTDDVIAHLMLMRGDEHMFWKRSNQHPPYVPQAGL